MIAGTDRGSLKKALTVTALLVTTTVLMLTLGCAVVDKVVEEVDQTIDEVIQTGEDTFCDSYPTEEQREACRSGFEPITGGAVEGVETPGPEPTGAHTVFVPAGDFTMGSDVFAGENPPHQVYLDGFYIDRYKVTNAQYGECVDAGVCEPPEYFEYYRSPQFNNHPLHYANWYHAQTYCQWAGKRLPTEAEWEKAARGTDARIWPWGNEFDPAKCNSYESHIVDTTPVGAYSPQGDSPYGVADMAGNVWEWTSTLHREYPYDPNDGREDLTQNAERVLRGGSWDSSRERVRCATRQECDPAARVDLVGFRCASSSP